MPMQIHAHVASDRAHHELCICAADEVKEVCALVGVLGGRVRASWHADEVQAQHAQHDPCCTLMSLLLQELPVHTSQVPRRLPRCCWGGCLTHHVWRSAYIDELLCLGCIVEDQMQAWQQERLQQLFELGVVRGSQDSLKPPCKLLRPARLSHLACLSALKSPTLLQSFQSMLSFSHRNQGSQRRDEACC